MKTKIDSTLAHVTLAILMLVGLGLLGSQLKAQEAMALRMGTTMAEAQGTLARLPHLSKEATALEISLKNEYLTGTYNFYQGQLESMRISRDYESEKVAMAALDGYLIYLGRINASLVPVTRGGRHIVYYAMTSDAHYELNLESISKKNFRFTVRIQSRNLGPDSPDKLDDFLQGGFAEAQGIHRTF